MGNSSTNNSTVIPKQSATTTLPSIGSRTTSPPAASKSPQKIAPTIAIDDSRPDDFTYHVVIIGEQGVGKTSLLRRFTKGTFSGKVEATEGIDFDQKSVMVGSTKVGLEIWDTAGNERTRVPSTFYQGCKGALVVYDVSNKETFDNIRKWVEDSDRLSGSQPAKWLIGNKSDVECAEGRVPFSEAKKLAAELGMEAIEVSAKNATNVDELFQKNWRKNQPTGEALMSFYVNNCKYTNMNVFLLFTMPSFPIFFCTACLFYHISRNVCLFDSKNLRILREFLSKVDPLLQTIDLC